ncbi:MAG TPA: YtxH domain-containing protein [Bacteroidales bacterium]|nr:YtxH domain-containing protein [Bacteroidales bacterium]
MAKTGSNALLAGIFGLAAGIGIGMLIAPAKGSKTRKRLKKRIMGFADFVEDGLSEKLSAMKSALGGEETGPDPDQEESDKEEVS